MSTIGGQKRVQQESSFEKKIGLFEGNVIAVNPDLEEYKDVLGMELKEDSKAVQYLGSNDDGNTTLRLDFWLEDIKTKGKFKVTFYLENKVKTNKDNTKKQYINNVGTTTWSTDPNDLPKWFTERDYRVAKVGEEDLYNFLKSWLGLLDYRHVDTTLEVEWSKLMKGNVRDLKALINGEFSAPFVAMATIKTVEKDGAVNSYQNVYNKAFLPSYALKQFRLINYDDQSISRKLQGRKPKELKIHEKFVAKVTDPEYGCRESFSFKDLKTYNPDDDLVATDRVIDDGDADY
jgi:hypothetical protein